MSQQLYYEVNQADLRYVQSKLKGMESKAPSVFRNAINRTATKVKKNISTGVKGAYTMKAKSYNKDITIQRATTAHLDATIKAQGRPRTLKEYKFSAPKRGVKSDITKSGLKELVSHIGGGHAFVGSGGSISGLIAQRTGPERFPLRVPKSVSVPKMVEKVYKGERGSAGDMEPTTRKTLHEELMAEVQKLM